MYLILDIYYEEIMRDVSSFPASSSCKILKTTINLD